MSKVRVPNAKGFGWQNGYCSFFELSYKGRDTQREIEREIKDKERQRDREGQRQRIQLGILIK